MIRNLAISLLVFWLAACAPLAINSSVSTPISIQSNSGAEGNVTIGPTCPVAQINNPCPDKPYQAAFTVLTTDQHEVIQFQTDLNGHFQINLAPGKYILRPKSPNVMPRANDITFSVVAGQYARVDVVYDSGIR